MSNCKILIVEDEKNLGLTLKEYLERRDYNIFLSKSCKDAKESFTQNHDIDIVLMDIGLPDGDGISLAKELKKIKKDFALIFLTAQNDPDVRLEAIEIGGHDYITKPFNLKELILRLERIIENVGSRNQVIPEEIIVGNLKIRFRQYEIEDVDNKVINLSQKECAILKLLYINSNSVVSRDKILEEVWGTEVYPSNRTVDNYIVKLRKWYETDNESKLVIESVRGVGYKLKIKD